MGFMVGDGLNIVKSHRANVLFPGTMHYLHLKHPAIYSNKLLNLTSRNGFILNDDVPFSTLIILQVDM